MRFDQLAVATGGTLLSTVNAARKFAGVSIDSRTVRKGQLFVAIRGPNDDGHSYIDAALKNGAAGVVSRLEYHGLEGIPDNVAVVTVPDTHEAMLTLARDYRKQLSARFVAITGSNGKTTTKEFTYRLLEAANVNCFRSPGNLNNLYGVPLAVFAIPWQTEIAVLELGISTMSEMPLLASLVEPDVIAITNVGPSHLQFLESVEAVAKAKLELVQTAAADVPVILNADDKLLMREARKCRPDFITFATDSEADFRPQSVQPEENGASIVRIDGVSFRLTLPGKHQVCNLLAAYAMVKTLGYSLEGVDTMAIQLETSPMRGQVVRRDGITIFADCYNANPESVRAGLDAFFDRLGGGRRVLILGDMLELGDQAAYYHRELGQQLAEREFDLAVLVGPLSKHVMEEATHRGKPQGKFLHFADAESCAHAVSGCVRDGDLVFVKASRGVGLEAVIDAMPAGEDA